MAQTQSPVIDKAPAAEFACPHCQHRYRVTAAQAQQYLGRTLPCRHCGQLISFPRPSADTAATASPSAPPASATDPTTSAPSAATDAPQQVIPLDYRQPPPRQSRTADVLAFRSMVSPRLLNVLFWICTIVMVARGTMLLAGPFVNPFAVRSIGLYTGPVPLSSAPSMYIDALLDAALWILIGPILVRIGCELILLLFRALERKANASAEPAPASAASTAPQTTTVPPP